MAYQDKNSKPKHRVLNVCGPAGRRQLSLRLANALADLHDPYHVATVGDFTETNEFLQLCEGVEKQMVAMGVDKEEASGLVKKWLMRFSKFEVEGSSGKPTLASRACVNALLSQAINRRKDDVGNLIDLRALVVFDCEDKYLPLLLERAVEPITVYFLEWGAEVSGIFPRPGYEHLEEEDPEDWSETFTPLGSWEVEPFTEIVKDILVLGGVHVWAGLFESYKSMAALELSSAILQGRPAFDHFPVAEKFVGSEILYLCLDMPHGIFLSYASNFGLPSDPRFVANDPKKPVSLAPDSPMLRAAVQGKILVVDTMLDIARIKDAFQSAEWVDFFLRLRSLVTECGCLAIVLVSHPTKSGARSSVIDPTEYLKDSVTFGGKIDVGFGFRKVDESEVHVERVKGRGFERPIKFSLAVRDAKGASWISRGRFPVVVAPEDGATLADKLGKKTGRPSVVTPEIAEKLKDCRKRKMSATAAAKEVGVSRNTVTEFWKQHEETLF
jgi:hypothetical protein